MTLHGTVLNGAIVLDQPQPFPDGTRVAVEVTEQPPPPADEKPTLAEGLLRLAGTVPGLPADFAAQHDHYIHGTPKR